ncbi:MAG: hypothetical protein HOQ02_03375 [Lysobacter sp.]|nr:hypothetical protein [Lysobacter sp.]
MRLPTLSAAALLLAACTVPPPRSLPTAPPEALPRPVAAAWTSASPHAATALASWTDEDGAVRVISASPAGLVVRDGDSGAVLADAAARAAHPRDPADMAVFGDHLFVVERGQHRAQVLSLPHFTPTGSIGAEQLAQPGGIWVDESGPDELRLFVADAGNARAARFLLQFDEAGQVQARADGGFPVAAGPRGLVGDPADNRLLVATASAVHAYDVAGHAGDHALPPAAALALWTCPDGGGYWLLAGPQDGIAVFDRATLAPRGGFDAAAGRPLTALDLHAAGSTRFPAGALYAVAGDTLVAFDLREIATALDLARDCVQ